MAEVEKTLSDEGKMTEEERKWERRFYDKGGLSAVYFMHSLFSLIDKLGDVENEKDKRELVLWWGLGVLPMA